GVDTSPVRRIVVTLGSGLHSFRRLVERLVAIIPYGVEVLWQTGSTPVGDLAIKAQPIVPADVLDRAIRHADAVIAHAGCGSALHELISPGFDGLDAGVTPVEFRSGYSPRHVTTQRWRDSFAAALAANGMDSLFVSARWLGALTDTYGFAVQASTLTVDGQVI